ncbi:MAG: PQQ-dependent sugar dehydrogenase [Acinetobacter sp.]|nr:MAG: PQQ-dependent sugar dehydrogenase [Acinetobacter sp.]
MKRLIFCLFLVLFIANCKKKSTETSATLPDVELKTKVVLSNLSNPWEIIYGPDNLIWFTEKSGKISRLNPSTGQVTTLHTITDVRVNGEGGLLGRFCTQTLQIVLLISNGKLFISTGDASDTSTPQNINSKSGKILRINLDGSIPADNPYPSNPVWSYGHRNPQGLAMVGSKLFSSEHGPDSDDEINIIEKGRNYGWPNVKGFCNETGEQSFCSSNNIAQPLIAWTPTIAPSGLTFYNSDYIPQFKNSLLLALLKDSKLMQLKLDDAQTKIEETKNFYVNEFGRLRAITQSPEGKIYICTSNGSNDKIIEISK